MEACLPAVAQLLPFLNIRECFLGSQACLILLGTFRWVSSYLERSHPEDVLVPWCVATTLYVALLLHLLVWWGLLSLLTLFLRALAS